MYPYDETLSYSKYCFKLLYRNEKDETMVGGFIKDRFYFDWNQKDLVDKLTELFSDRNHWHYEDNWTKLKFSQIMREVEIPFITDAEWTFLEERDSQNLLAATLKLKKIKYVRTFIEDGGDGTLVSGRNPFENHNPFDNIPKKAVFADQVENPTKEAIDCVPKKVEVTREIEEQEIKP